MDKVKQLMSRYKCCCSLRTLAFINASLELVLLAVATGILIFIEIVEKSLTVMEVVLPFIVVNFVLTSLLVHGIRKNLQEIVRGWLWVRVTTMVTVLMMIIFFEIFNGLLRHPVTWGSSLAFFVFTTYVVFVIIAYASTITNNEQHLDVQEMNVPDYRRMEESADGRRSSLVP